MMGDPINRRATDERNRYLVLFHSLPDPVLFLNDDLNEPLRMMSSFVELLQRRYEDQLDEKGTKYIQFAVEGAERMRRLLDDLLKLSRVGTRGDEFKPVEPGEALDRALSNLGHVLRESSGEVSRGELPVVLGDETQLIQLFQLFQKLVGNGVKFRKPGQAPRLRVSGRLLGRLVEFGVQDNGIGVGQDCAEKIFEVFRRLHSREQYPGSGIGLSICKKIVQRHGGCIWLEPGPDGGALFKFTLPAPPSIIQNGG